MSSEPHGRLQPCMPTDNSPTAYIHPHITSSSEKKRNTVNEECYSSPPLSPSPSHPPSSYPRNPFFRYGSAPLSIPTVRAGGGGSRLPPSPRRKDKQQCSSQNENLTHSPNDKSIVSKDLVKLSEFHNAKYLQKVLSFGNDDLMYFRGLKLTHTSSKLFIMDELDERELVFAWEDKDTIIDQLNRIDLSDWEDHESSQELGGSLTRSPDAAIGILMRVLKNAPGLRERLLTVPSAGTVPQEPSSLQRVVTEEHGSGASSSAVVPSALLRSRTAADALQELNRYKQIRESILSRSRGHPCSTELEENPADGDP
nr:unknown [Zea mays]